MKTMNKHEFAQWLRTEIAELNAAAPDPAICEGAADVVREARRIAQSLGYPDLIPTCRTDFLALPVAREHLSRALAVMDPPTSGSLTVRQAAERLGVSPKTIYDLVEKGRIRCTRIGRAIRINPADLNTQERPKDKHLWL
jgi:excisionase family DNA binding protein